MLIFTPLCFHLCWMLIIDLKLITCSDTIYPLDMAEKSVDDMFDGCRDPMKGILKQKFHGEKEFWTFDHCKGKELKKDDPKEMTKEHLQALCMYTGNDYYKDFNRDTREQRNNYGKSFKFHSLYFYLTTALQILNPKQQCQTTYRRTRSIFDGKKNQKIRFGFFTSSSKRSDLVTFGKQTCFKIETCLGAYIEKYSTAVGEEEVLIPPYETFTIEEKVSKEKAPEGLKDCQLVYVLKHLGGKSELNCELFKKFSGAQG